VPTALEVNPEELGNAFHLIKQRSTALGISYPSEITLFELNRAAFIEELAADLTQGRYAPVASPVADIPKGAGALRPVRIISVRDQIAYAVLGARCLEPIANDLGQNHRYVDFSWRIRDPISPREWFHPYFRPWSEFGTASLRILEGGATVMCETDISGFYENIDHRLLLSDLRRVRIPENVMLLLRDCLNAWSFERRGLPQSCVTSHLLAKLYLGTIDSQLVNMGFVARRFSDDMRLFSATHPDAKRALQELIRLLRARTLGIQTAKTNFLNGDDAREKILGFRPVVQDIRDRYREAELAELADLIMHSEYAPVAELAEEADEADNIPAEVLREAYRIHVQGRVTPQDGFNKSAFHFLLGKFKKTDDGFAIDDCLGRFIDQPQETLNILDYFRSAHLSGEQESRLLDFTEHDQNVYDYQTFEILRYLSDVAIHDQARVLSIARRYAFGAAIQPYVAAWARHLLGLLGTHADLDAMLQIYPAARNDLERAEIICAVHRMEAARRNAFFANIRDQSLLVQTAIQHSRRA
jgi:hypothetical protein